MKAPTPHTFKFVRIRLKTKIFIENFILLDGDGDDDGDGDGGGASVIPNTSKKVARSKKNIQSVVTLKGSKKPAKKSGRLAAYLHRARHFLIAKLCFELGLLNKELRNQEFLYLYSLIFSEIRPFSHEDVAERYRAKIRSLEFQIKMAETRIKMLSFSFARSRVQPRAYLPIKGYEVRRFIFEDDGLLDSSSRATLHISEFVLSSSLQFLAWCAADKYHSARFDAATVYRRPVDTFLNGVAGAVAEYENEILYTLHSVFIGGRFFSVRVRGVILGSSIGRAYPRFYIRGYGKTTWLDLSASHPVFPGRRIMLACSPLYAVYADLFGSPVEVTIHPATRRIIDGAWKKSETGVVAWIARDYFKVLQLVGEKVYVSATKFISHISRIWSRQIPIDADNINYRTRAHSHGMSCVNQLECNEDFKGDKRINNAPTTTENNSVALNRSKVSAKQLCRSSELAIASFDLNSKLDKVLGVGGTNHGQQKSTGIRVRGWKSSFSNGYQPVADRRAKSIDGYGENRISQRAGQRSSYFSGMGHDRDVEGSSSLFNGSVESGYCGRSLDAGFECR